jgi:hypothetical protein
MLPFENLHNVFAYNKLFSKIQLDENKIPFTSIANDEVQRLRSRIFVFDLATRTYRPLHSYVPFYFATRTPMLYVMHTNRSQDHIVIFEVDRMILRSPGVVFSDGNASLQQLSKFTGEKVRIVPATIANTTCRRKYLPIGPIGTNTHWSNFYGDITFLDKLNWKIINGSNFTTLEEKRIKHAEVLVPDYLPISQIHSISVSNHSMVAKVNSLITEYGLQNHVPTATYNPQLFF